MKRNLKYEKVDIVRIRDNQKEEVPDFIIRESRLSIILNNEKIINLKCSPGNGDYLGIGFLYASGILKKKEDIHSVVVHEEAETVEIIAKNISTFQEDSIGENLIAPSGNIESSKVVYKTIFQLMNSLQERAKLFKLTGGTHSCALADKRGSIILFTEDISRYNTIDKILGETFLNGIVTEDKIILTSCRITSGILKKIIIGKLPVVISRAAPTDRAIELAQKIGITLVGFVRGKRMNIYTHPERIEFE